MDDLFADGVADITVINGVARLTLVSLEAGREGREAGEAKPVPVAKHRLIMPLAGLVNVIQQAQALIARMEQAGAAPRPTAEAQKQSAPVPAAKTATPSSPNF